MGILLPRHSRSFEDAVTRLNAGNSTELWELAAALSVLEFFGSSELDLFPSLHFERPRLFAEAILRSRASPSRHRQYQPHEFIDIVNWSSEGLADSRFTDVAGADSHSEAVYRLLRALARMANIQIRYQDVANGDIGRAVALYEVIPAADHFRDHATCLLVERVRGRIEQYLRCCVSELLLVYAQVGLWCVRLYRCTKDALPRSLRTILVGKRGQLERLSAILQWLYSSRSHLGSVASFSWDTIERFGGTRLRPEAVAAFIACWSKDTRGLRALLESPAYTAGSSCWRLSPLERYPVVALDPHPSKSTSLFVVPNYRFFLCSLPRSLDYALQDGLDDDYNQFRGAVYEEYVTRMFRDAYPNSPVIEERPYKSGKSEAKGPDIVFAEAPGEPLVLIEVKARRVQATTRSNMDDESLDDNLGDAYRALAKLPRKADDLFSDLPEYPELRERIAQTNKASTLCLCVLPETPFAINELTYYRATHELHQLSSMDLPYCIMSVATLERAVAYAQLKEMRLSAVLLEFIYRARNPDAQGPLAEFFGGTQFPQGRLYGEGYLKHVELPRGIDAEASGG